MNGIGKPDFPPDSCMEQKPTCLTSVLVPVGGAYLFPSDIHLGFEVEVEVAVYMSNFGSDCAVSCTFCMCKRLRKSRMQIGFVATVVRFCAGVVVHNVPPKICPPGRFAQCTMSPRTFCTSVQCPPGQSTLGQTVPLQGKMFPLITFYFIDDKSGKLLRQYTGSR